MGALLANQTHVGGTEGGSVRRPGPARSSLRHETETRRKTETKSRFEAPPARPHRRTSGPGGAETRLFRRWEAVASEVPAGGRHRSLRGEATHISQLRPFLLAASGPRAPGPLPTPPAATPHFALGSASSQRGPAPSRPRPRRTLGLTAAPPCVLLQATAGCAALLEAGNGEAAWIPRNSAGPQCPNLEDLENWP